MKKILFVVSLFTMTAMVATAQTTATKFGVKAGLNISTITGDVEGAESKAGFYAGGYARIPLADKFTFQPEVLFSLQGAKGKTSDPYLGISYEENTHLSYINIPLMFQYEFVNGFRGEFGPQLGFNVAAKDTWKESYLYGSNSSIRDVKDQINTFDFGLNIGLNYELTNGLNFSARYSFGLTNIAKDSNGKEAHNSVFSVGAGYTF